jgi:hypothetical protein
MKNCLSALARSVRVSPTLLSLALLASSPGIAQTDNYRAPRTADGHPSLQGMWTNNTITPLERPPELADRQFLTQEEQMAMELAVAAATAEADLPSDPNRPPPTKDQIDLEDSYNAFWFDDGTKVSMQWDRCEWKPGERTVSGSVKYFVEMLMEAEAHQQPSLKQHRMNHKEGIAAAANFLTKLEDGQADVSRPLSILFSGTSNRD